MTRREILMRTLQGQPVPKVPFCFYEINAFDQKHDDPDPFNVYNDPSWKPLLELAAERSYRIIMRGVVFESNLPNPAEKFSVNTIKYEGDSIFYTSTIKIGKRTLTSRARRDKDVNTIWTMEHLLKDTEDLKAFLSLPVMEFSGKPKIESVTEAEKAIGDSGIVMIDTADPLCLAASLFHMEDFTIIAMSEQKLFHQLLDRFAYELFPKTEAIAKALPGRLWRIYGPEYASPPYLPPSLFKEYAADYDRQMVASIQKYGGFARIHSHGNLMAILDHIASTGCSALDPIEPPPQGDVSLSYVRKKYGQQMVLFGNIEASDIENLPENFFAEKVRKALEEGTEGKGRGFVLMPSASPYGRKLSAQALRNYEIMTNLAEQFSL